MSIIKNHRNVAKHYMQSLQLLFYISGSFTQNNHIEEIYYLKKKNARPKNESFKREIVILSIRILHYSMGQIYGFSR